MSSCDITKAKLRLSGLETTDGKSGKLKKIHRLTFMLCTKVQSHCSLDQKFCFNWKIIVV